MLEVSGKLSEVQPGDVMFKGTVATVMAPRSARSGRMLMTITFIGGEHWIVDPEREANWQRPE